jgi:type II secretory pathway component GspD/PulD (secretin)
MSGVHFINLYDALKLVCDVTGMKFSIRNGVVWIVPENTVDEKNTTRIFPLPPSYSCASCERNGANAGLCAGENHTQHWAPFFEQRDVHLAIASSLSVKKLSSINLLCVTSSRQSLDEIEQVLEELFYSRKVEVDVQIHAFSTKEIEQLRLAGDMSIEALMTLRKQGKSKQVASATVVTKSGQEAIVKAVREVLYPTELSNTSGEGGGVLMPSSFAMREVGMTLLVVPEIIATDQQPQIRLKVKPQWVTLDRWHSYPANLGAAWTHKTIPFKQPVFGMTNFETETIVQNGESVLLGSSSTPDGKWVHVGFLTAKECL